VADFVAAANAGADAVLAASVFHYGTLTIAEVKAGLAEADFAVHAKHELPVLRDRRR
jgi:cyclase